MFPLLQYIKKDALHHAYLLIGEREVVKSSLFDFFDATLRIARVGNPDFSFLEYNTLTVDDARLLAESQSRKNFGSGRKIFVIAANTITEETQNALLKIFEEPTAGTHFF